MRHLQWTKIPPKLITFDTVNLTNSNNNNVENVWQVLFF